jgi:hypothetical protein
MRYNTLLEAQMGEYPDSVVLTPRQMHYAMKVGIPDWMVNHKYEDWQDYASRCEMGVFAPIYYRDWRALQIEQTRAQWARNAYYHQADTPEGFFYACCKRDDGTYRYIGFRYGLEDCEYASGFDGLTYTPEGESK